ncbi:MAG: histidine--tRNA ligase [Nanoarchaeota archaeon]
MAFKKIKGATDYYPAEQLIQDCIYSDFAGVAKNYGFEHVEPPVLERIELLTAKSGEEIKEQIFPIEKRGKEEIGLRFEFTAGIARMFVQKQKSLSKPVKWFSFNKAWRYERPQSGREREFFQFNAELIGSDKVEADAELINMAIDCLCSLGLTKNDFFVKLNNRKLLYGLLQELVPEEKITPAIRIIDKKEKITKEQFQKELSDCGVNNTKDIENILYMSWEELSNEFNNMNETAKEGFNELKQITEYAYKDFLKFDISIARGLDYYTGIVFEIFDTNQELRALGGGGRYDNMIEVFGGEKCPATGFGLGYSPLLLYLEKKNLLPEYKKEYDYFVINVSYEYKKDAIKIANKLREKNSVLVDLMGRNLGKQLKHANSAGAKKVIFVGEEEMKKGNIKLKDMETGEEKELKLSELGL